MTPISAIVGLMVTEHVGTSVFHVIIALLDDLTMLDSSEEQYEPLPVEENEDVTEAMETEHGKILRLVYDQIFIIEFLSFNKSWTRV